MFIHDYTIRKALYSFILLNLFYNCIAVSLLRTAVPETHTDLSQSREVSKRGENQDSSHKQIWSKRHLRKRHLNKNLGEKCFKFSDCVHFAVCIHGICSCPYDNYIYISPNGIEGSVCRKKLKYGYMCSLSEDCSAHDPNTACFDGYCRCINGTHYIGSRNPLSYDRKCYKILDREGDKCVIDEQCSRLTDKQHKCRCVGVCDCASIEHYGGCSICHENIKRTFFGGAAFIVLLLTSRFFTRMRRQSSSSQSQNTATNSNSQRSQMLCSNTVPTVSLNGQGLTRSRRVASLPNVFLIDHHNVNGLPSSQTTHFLPHSSNTSSTSTTQNNDDCPPSYDDIVESDQLVWNEPPPAYEEVALKCLQPRKP